MKHCSCGCRTFEFTVRQKIDSDGNICFEDSAEGDVLIGNHEDVIEEEWLGPYICIECGKEYNDLDDIPDD